MFSKLMFKQDGCPKPETLFFIKITVFDHNCLTKIVKDMLYNIVCQGKLNRIY